jgi:hypothetical protein
MPFDIQKSTDFNGFFHDILILYSDYGWLCHVHPFLAIHSKYQQFSDNLQISSAKTIKSSDKNY